MALLSSLKQIAGIESGPISDAFRPEFFKLVLGTLSLPIDLPGTNYRKGFQVHSWYIMNFCYAFTFLFLVVNLNKWPLGLCLFIFE